MTEQSSGFVPEYIIQVRNVAVKSGENFSPDFTAEDLFGEVTHLKEEIAETKRKSEAAKKELGKAKRDQSLLLKIRKL